MADAGPGAPPADGANLDQKVSLRQDQREQVQSGLAQMEDLQGATGEHATADPNRKRVLPPPLPGAPATDNTALANNILEELWFGDIDPNHTRAEASKSLAATVAELEGLKPFPVVAQRVLTLLLDEKTVVGQVVEVLEKDPALAGKILRVANSALFRSRVPSTTIEAAIVRVGLNQLQEMLVGIAVVSMFKDKKGVGKRFRDHCAAVGAIGKTIAAKKGWSGSGQVFLAGLMHDIGKLLMMQTKEFAYDELPADIISTPDQVHLHERSALGWDHAVLGAHALRSWKIPDPIPKVVGWHHQPGRAFQEGGDVGLMVACLRIANAVDHRLAEGGELDDDFLDELGKDSACEYLAAGADFLKANREALVDSRSEALELFR